MWAFSLAALYSADFGCVLAATEMEELPPWQSVQPRKTVFVGCIVGSSVEVWQEMQPDDLRAASFGDWPRTDGAPCFARRFEAGATQRTKIKDNAETQSAQRSRRKEGLNLRVRV